MRTVRFLWLVLRKSAEAVGTLLLWIVWLGLAIALCTQLYIAFSHELAVPAWVLRQVEHRLEISGLRASFGEAIFDPSGHVFMEDIRIRSETVEDPLVTIRTLHFKIDPWALLIGDVDPRQIRADGVNFFVPAMLSPTGKSEPVLEDLYLAAEPFHQEWRIEHFTGRLGNVALSAHGSLRFAPAPGAKSREPVSLEDVLRDYLRASRALAAFLPEFEALEAPDIDLEFTSHLSRIAWVNARLSARHGHIDASRVGAPAGWGELEASDLAVNFVAPIAGSAPVETRVFAEFAELKLPAHGFLRDAKIAFNGTLRSGPYSFSPDSVNATAALASYEEIEAEYPVAHLDLKQLPRLSADLTARVGNEIWRVGGRADPGAKNGDVHLDGHLSPELFSLIGDKLHVNLNELVKAEEPPALSANVTLGPDWKLGLARGTLSVGKAEAHRVSLDQASADFSLQGTNLRVTDIVLYHGANVARGDYLMDTATNEYQFLLLGRLRPIVISGWFQEWWQHFWGHFDFTVSPPDADVQVVGTWGHPESTIVFVTADCLRPVIQSVSFDRIRATLFIRPDFYDALGFIADREQHQARGTFTRAVDLEKEGVRYMDFKLTSDLDVRESARIFGSEGTEIVDPFRFAEPPSLKLTGHIDGPASEKGEHKEVEIEVKSTGAFSFYNFPLTDVSFGAHLHDDDLDVRDLSVTFAGGHAHGKARLSGKDEARKLGFDCALEDASLGEAIRTTEQFAAAQRGETPSPVSKFQERVSQARLKLLLTAEGAYHDPYSYQGTGRVEIAGAELAQINLLGALSEALRGSSVLGFTSLRLNSVQSDFTVEKDRLMFPNLKITGTTAEIDLKGNFGVATKQMEFNAKLYPFEQGKTLLANAVGLVLTPLSAVLELKLTGTLDKPNWRFAYGPTSLLRNLAGKKDDVSHTEAPPEVKDTRPPPLLRR